jgi:hypothetical protein
MSVLHVVFSPSAAGSLREALFLAERPDRVVALFDDFSFGPINPPDPNLRRAWEGDVLGYEEIDLGAEDHAFWSEALKPQQQLLVWTSRRSPKEYTGFLEWLSRFGAAECGVVDLTEMTTRYRNRDGQLSKPEPAVFATMQPGQILDDHLLDRGRPLSSAERDRHMGLWRRLREDNAAFRVVYGNGLISAPLTHFDGLLLSLATAQWQKMARVVAMALTTFHDDGVFQTGDLVLAARVRALIETRALEARGDPMQILQCEVRLSGAA